MKLMMLELAGILGGATVLGYMYMKKHPEKMKAMKENVKEMSRTIYNKLDMED